MKSENWTKFFHFHPEVPAVGVVLCGFLFGGLGSPALMPRLARPLSFTADRAATAAHTLLQRGVAGMPGVLDGSTCEAQQRRDAIRKQLRRELEERAREKAERDAAFPRRSRVEYI